MTGAAALSATLSATETAYFHAAHFAREKGLVDAVPVVGTDKKYDGSELGGALLAIALLDAERRGAVELEVAKAGRLFGLRKVDALFVKPGPRPDDSLPHTLESRVRPYVDSRKTPPEADAVLAAVLQEDSADPYAWTVALVARGMGERKLLDVVETRRLKVFRAQQLQLPEATAALARATSPQPVRDLVERARTQRPQVWELLQKAIRSAVAMRTERDSDYGPD